MNITYETERLIHYLLKKELITVYDVIPSRNYLYDLLQIKTPDELTKIDETLETPNDILNNIFDYLTQNNMIENTVTQRELMESRIMGNLMPKAGEVVAKFNTFYEKSPKDATDYFYKLSKDCNYIQVENLSKNLHWTTKSEFGNMEITINLSKPEKDPKEIEKSKSAPQTGYPKCLLCKENAGFTGNLNHPGRQNLRLIPVEIDNNEFFLQYSPYLYYNEHSILLSEKHEEMKLSKNTFKRLFGFIEKFPHYFIGSNADLPIVGGSILSHDHFQAGNHDFPMENAEEIASFRYSKYEDIHISIVNWPLSVVRVTSTDNNYENIVEVCDHIFNTWKEYADEESYIIPYTNKTPHNTVTPIGRKNKNGLYEMDIVLRNNRTTEQYPYGIFHPHENYHNIKKENIGLIEVMGLAILPGRLYDEVSSLADMMINISDENMDSLSDSNHPLHVHEQWFKDVALKYDPISKKEDTVNILYDEIGKTFVEILKNCGVFQANENGLNHFTSFLLNCGFEVHKEDVCE